MINTFLGILKKKLGLVREGSRNEKFIFVRVFTGFENLKEDFALNAFEKKWRNQIANFNQYC